MADYTHYPPPQVPQPVRSPRLASSASYYGATAVVFAVGGLIGVFMILLGNGILIPLFPVITVVSVVYWSFYTWLLWWLINKAAYFRRPGRLVQWASFVWGAVVAIGVATLVNSSLVGLLTTTGGWVADWSAALIAPIVEESIKTVGVAFLLLYLARPRTPVDGFIVGALVGLGFQIVEDITYGLQSGWLNGADSLGAMASTTIVRSVAGASSHWLFTGISGIGLAYAISMRREKPAKRAWVAIGTFLIAVGFHFVWNAPFPDVSDWVILAIIAVKILVMLWIGLLFLRWARNADGAHYSYYLREVDTYWCSQAERIALAKGRTRRAARRALQRGPKRKAQRLRQRAQAQIAVGLAENQQERITAGTEAITTASEPTRPDVDG